MVLEDQMNGRFALITGNRCRTVQLDCGGGRPIVLWVKGENNKRGCSFEQPLEKLVASIGFEPTISALRGRRPKPLDDEAISAYWLGWKESNPHIRYQKPLSYH